MEASRLDDDLLVLEGDELKQWGCPPCVANGALELLPEDEAAHVRMALDDEDALEAGQAVMDAAQEHGGGDDSHNNGGETVVTTTGDDGGGVRLQAELGGPQHCLAMVRASLRHHGGGAGRPRGVPPSNNETTMDGDHTLSHHDGVAHTPETILDRRRVVTNDWTHMVLRPAYKRAQVLDALEARDLYVGLGGSTYIGAGMGIMERVLSHVTRLSLHASFKSYAANEAVEAARLTRALAVLAPAVYASLGVSSDDHAARLCLVLRPEATCVPQQYILHWPQLTVRRTDVDHGWCAGLPSPPDTEDIPGLTPRNTHSFYPMYGCTDGTIPAMRVWAVYSRGELRCEVGVALQEWMACPGVHVNVGVGLRLPVSPSARTLEYVLPLLCSIVPGWVSPTTNKHPPRSPTRWAGPRATNSSDHRIPTGMWMRHWPPCCTGPRTRSVPWPNVPCASCAVCGMIADTPRANRMRWAPSCMT